MVLRAVNERKIRVIPKRICRISFKRGHHKTIRSSPRQTKSLAIEKSGLAGLQLEPDCREEPQASENVKTLQQTEGSEFRSSENSPGAQPADSNLMTLTTTTIWHGQEPPLLDDILRLA